MFLLSSHAKSFHSVIGSNLQDCGPKNGWKEVVGLFECHNGTFWYN